MVEAKVGLGVVGLEVAVGLRVVGFVVGLSVVGSAVVGLHGSWGLFVAHFC